MSTALSRVCDELRAPGGEQLLRLLSCVYEGGHQVESLRNDFGNHGLDMATRLGLLDACGQKQVILSSAGYVVGNVAKEYIHWIDNGREMPPPYPPQEFIKGKDVLDLGCSFGRWLWRFQKDARSVIGLELQKEYIELGRVLAEREGIPCPEIHQGSAEELRGFVTANSVDLVFARLVLNHVRIRKTLVQIADVLREDGVVWVQISPWSTPFHQLLQKNMGRRLRQSCFDMFSIVNSMICATTHRQIALKVRGRMHSEHKPAYLTLRAWKSIVLRSGLRDFRIVQRDVFFARKA